MLTSFSSKAVSFLSISFTSSGFTPRIFSTLSKPGRAAETMKFAISYPFMFSSSTSLRLSVTLSSTYVGVQSSSLFGLCISDSLDSISTIGKRSGFRFCFKLSFFIYIFLNSLSSTFCFYFCTITSIYISSSGSINISKKTPGSTG